MCSKILAMDGWVRFDIKIRHTYSEIGMFPVLSERREDRAFSGRLPGKSGSSERLK